MKTVRIALLASAALCSTLAGAQSIAKLKAGMMRPATGTFASLGTAIENGFKLYVQEQSGKIGGREVEFVKVDDESEPAKPPTTSTG